MADALEADWNARSRQLDALQREHERQREADRTLLDEPARQRIVALAADFPRVWCFSSHWFMLAAPRAAYKRPYGK